MSAPSWLADATSRHDRLVEIAENIGKTVAGPNSSDVDASARFPVETVEALRTERLLSALVPVDQGGLGATLTDVSDVIRIISRYCAASGCVLAMHSSDIYCILRHGTTPAFQALVGEIVERQLLVANATSEIKIDGISASLTPEPGGFRFDKHVAASSYGLYADLITSTIRSSADAAETDQVIGVFPTGELSLVPISEWNTLGMRGTCSRGLHITGHIDAGSLYPEPYARIANGAGQSIHVLLTAVWTGLAEAALEEAQVKVRADARKDLDVIPQSATRLAELLIGVQAARSTLAQGLVLLETAAREDAIDNPALLTAMRNIKLITTTTAVTTATLALQICGLPGFRRGDGNRLERVIRDSFGGLVMLSNDRLLHDNAAVLRLIKSI